MTEADLSIFSPQSEQALRLQGLNIYYLIASSVIMLLVIGLLIYITYRFRARAGDAEPRQVQHHPWIEGIMIGIPLLMVGYFFILTLGAMKETEPAPGDAEVTVVISGRQWWWKVSYPGTGVISANEIHLPVGKKILLKLQSGDVIHDWWVPALGPKADLVPGVENHLWLRIRESGTFGGVCSEFCGTQHAWMRIKVVAQPPEDFKRWLDAQSSAADRAANPEAVRGEAIFQKESCAGCHRIRGTPAQGDEGPDLTHLGSRRTLLAGVAQNNARNLRKFLEDPDEIKPGVHMPRYLLEKDTLNALVSYLTQLK